MVVDEKASSFFNSQMSDSANCICCDCGTGDASWASISHGIYLSIGAAGVHRSLGVKVSFVQSTTMDSWQPLHLKMMELGGNRRFNEYLRAQGVPEDMPIRLKYSTRAAQWYREDLRAEAEGSERPAPLDRGTGHLAVQDSRQTQQRLLDRIYAKTPSSSSSPSPMTCESRHSRDVAPNGLCMPPNAASDDGEKLNVSDGIQVPTQRPSLQRSRSLDLGNSLAAERRHSLRRRKSFAAQLPNSLSLWLPSNPLPILLGSTRCPTAERLQTMSSGKMEGFGSDTFRSQSVIESNVPALVAAAA